MLSILFSILVSATFATERQIIQRNVISVPHPSFLNLQPNPLRAEAPDLIISSFGLTGKDHVYRLSNVPTIFNQGNGTASTITDQILWPNEVMPLNAMAFGKPGYLISSGFLMPGKSTGAVTFLDMAGTPYQLTTNKSGYFYHRAVFADVTGTGRQDLITARGKISAFGGSDGELVWLKRPTNPLSVWEEVVLAKGPDIHFRVFPDPANHRLVVVTAEFSNKRLGLYWVAQDGRVASRIIDNTLGAPFDLNAYDLNNDGRLELLVTNHQKDLSASVFAYEIPADLQSGSWIRHTLLTNIETRQGGFNQASPGVAKAFFPEATRAGKEKPWIIVSGDGSQRLHLLIPQSNSRADWDYTETIVLDTKSTVGEPVIYDFDKDGLADIVVPAYDANMMYFLSVVKK